MTYVSGVDRRYRPLAGAATSGARKIIETFEADRLLMTLPVLPVGPVMRELRTIQHCALN